jgi:hypothetical protein
MSPRTVIVGPEQPYWRSGVISYPLCQDCGTKLHRQPRIIIGRWYCCQSCALNRDRSATDFG